MGNTSSTQIKSVLKEYQKSFDSINERQMGLIREIRKVIDDKKIKNIKKDLGMDK